jgi:ABC-type multidrug transport system fused ATPase/permease subunit
MRRLKRPNLSARNFPLFTNEKFIMNSRIRVLFSIFEREDKFRYAYIVIGQIGLGILDILGIGIFALIGNLSVKGIQDQSPSPNIIKGLELLNLESFSFQIQVFVLSTIAIGALLVRSLISMYVSRKILRNLSFRAAVVSDRLIARIFSQNWIEIKAKSNYETVYSITNGVPNLIVGVIGSILTVISDLILIVILSLGVFFINIAASLFTILFFVLVITSLSISLRPKSRKIGSEMTNLSIYSEKLMYETLNMYKELFVMNRRNFYANKIAGIRYKLADVLADNAFLPQISKYVLESSFLVFCMIVGAIHFWLLDASEAVSSILVFIVAGSRIGPAALRLQQGINFIRTNFEASNVTLDLIKRLDSQQYASAMIQTQGLDQNKNNLFEPSVVFNQVSYNYPNSSENAISNLSFKIAPGEELAIVGPSGAGKTTTINLLLGLLKPTQGLVKISGLSPESAFSSFPGKVAFVPQDIFLLDGTIRENICLGRYGDDDHIWEALEISQLAGFVEGLESGLDQRIGFEGFGLSGGQKQRLNLARAIFSKPELVVLDEATNALDFQTEIELHKTFAELRKTTTFVVVAHKLSTVRNANQILYIDKGTGQLFDSFEELSNEVPEYIID